MNKEIWVLYHEGILAEAAARFGTSADQTTKLGDPASFVYEYAIDGTFYMLKITHTARNSPEHLMGELEWLNYLADNGVAVSRAVPSIHQRMIESIPAADGQFLAVSYEKAPGKSIGPEEWHEEMFRKWGQALGRMHSLAKQYRPSNPAFKRREWHEEDAFNLQVYIPADQSRVLEAFEELMERLHALPTSADSYGLIHIDLHQFNFFWHDGEIVVFDFDDCMYGWFVADIAMAVYYALEMPQIPYDNKTEFTGYFLQHFLNGYRQEHDLDSWWLQHIPDFLAMRKIVTYCVMHQEAELNGGVDEELRKLVADTRTAIENGTPITEFDFFSLERGDEAGQD